MQQLAALKTPLSKTGRVLNVNQSADQLPMLNQIPAHNPRV